MQCIDDCPVFLVPRILAVMIKLVPNAVLS